ncbi:MAG: siderophore-interacting protein [Nocardioides sp.]|nr:siderophore-interacting protein [Nocardioides sp.]
MITAEVARNVRVSAHFALVTLCGDELRHLELAGNDQAVRLFFPRQGQPALQMPTLSNDAWMAQLLLQPKSRRPWVRMYTIRASRPGEVDIEVALHGDAGPGSVWATTARPGDPVGLFDEGHTYRPTDNTAWQLLVGDESAVPAILAILEQAPLSLVGEAFLEVPTSADIRTDITRPAGVQVHWLARDNHTMRPGALALGTVQTAELTGTPLYTWVAGESRLATGLRRYLVNERNIAKSDISFTGYWRQGRASPG